MKNEFMSKEGKILSEIFSFPLSLYFFLYSFSSFFFFFFLGIGR